MKIYMLHNEFGLYAVMGVDAVDAAHRFEDRHPELVSKKGFGVSGSGDMIDLEDYWMYFTMHPSSRKMLRDHKPIAKETP